MTKSEEFLRMTKSEEFLRMTIRDEIIVILSVSEGSYQNRVLQMNYDI